MLEFQLMLPLVSIEFMVSF